MRVAKRLEERKGKKILWKGGSEGRKSHLVFFNLLILTKETRQY